MTIEHLEKRIADLSKAVEESAARHNILCGHRAEAEHILSEMKKCLEKSCDDEKVAEAPIEE